MTRAFASLEAAEQEAREKREVWRAAQVEYVTVPNI